jgi:hypothetical protein
MLRTTGEGILIQVGFLIERAWRASIKVYPTSRQPTSPLRTDVETFQKPALERGERIGELSQGYDAEDRLLNGILKVRLERTYGNESIYI